ncbi:hypothetical protein BUALT_Bualt01G0233400 [Buddleja alternifolia]|uniref:WRKY domain-containing protein n=1 Tax=Buddleja alternifolia TaxID=168488 RepID=A0AAV6YJZ2_9LAMI|nr:hypothetical protein BUALT_Bualt01G0233400 [Buddleja alternifolia]
MEGQGTPETAGAPPRTDQHYILTQTTPFQIPSFPPIPRAEDQLSEMGFSGLTAGMVDQSQMLENSCGGSENVCKNRRISRSKKWRIPRFEFQTRSKEDILDDGFRWRKYGQKSVKDSKFPRSYYRCTHLTCNVKKQVQRLSKDTTIVVTTYDGIHNHPSEILMETLSPLLQQIQFLSTPASTRF